MGRKPEPHTYNTTLAIAPKDRNRMLAILAEHQLETGEKLTLKALVSKLIDIYEKGS